MFGLSFLNPWKWGSIGAGIMLVLALGWAFRLEHMRAKWEAKFTLLDAQSQSVLIATRAATQNPKLVWLTVPDQITALGESNGALKTSIENANSKFAALNTDYLKAKASGDLLRSDLGAAQAGRQGALDALRASAKTPGDRSSCPALISQTQDALDAAWRSGL